MVDHPCLIGGGVHLGTQRGGATVHHLLERLPHGGPHLVMVPVRPSKFQGALKRRSVGLPHGCFSSSWPSYRSRATTMACQGKSVTISVMFARESCAALASRAANFSIGNPLS